MYLKPGKLNLNPCSHNHQLCDLDVICEDQRLHGKALSGNRAGQWRYRVGDYRIIAIIHDNELVVLVVNVGHRREVYQLKST